ncbi:MAG TPA: hypothetical protein VMG11_03380 [Steroidobacteraceae bacterium]|nr:hypothetical protein [Steroidobacteraceae bacterium]
MKLARGAFLSISLACATLAAAEEFDGSMPLTCTPSAGQDCQPTKACGKLKPESKGPIEMQIDFANKTVKTPYRTTLLPIQNSAMNEQQLIMQGTDLKFAWSAIVNRKTGALTLAIADRVGAYVIFGKCKAAGSG